MNQQRDYSLQAFDLSEFFGLTSQEHFQINLEPPLAYRQPSMHGDFDRHPYTPPLNPPNGLFEESASIAQPQPLNSALSSSFQITDPDQDLESHTRSSRGKKAIRRQKRQQINRTPRNRQSATQTNHGQCQGTKSFLVFFKNPHKDCFEKFIALHPQYCHLRDHPDVKRAFYTQGYSITRWDYEPLYRILELFDCWSTMLKQHKYLLQHLMVGKARICQKLVYRTKIHLFEKAFKLGKFKNIN